MVENGDIVYLISRCSLVSLSMDQDHHAWPAASIGCWLLLAQPRLHVPCRHGAGRVSLGSADKGGCQSARSVGKEAGASVRLRGQMQHDELEIYRFRPAMLCRKALALLSRVRAYS